METKDALIKTMITDIFECGYGNYTFYGHNFAWLDGHFITNSLLVDLPNYENIEDVRLIVGDSNDLIQMQIKEYIVYLA